MTEPTEEIYLSIKVPMSVIDEVIARLEGGEGECPRIADDMSQGLEKLKEPVFKIQKLYLNQPVHNFSCKVEDYETTVRKLDKLENKTDFDVTYRIIKDE